MEAYEHGTEVERQSRGMPKYCGKKRSHFVHHNSHTHCTGTETSPHLTSFMNMWFASLTKEEFQNIV
jgi:hypothetical protein